jgi:hypothetical protein
MNGIESIGSGESLHITTKSKYKTEDGDEVSLPLVPILGAGALSTPTVQLEKTRQLTEVDGVEKPNGGRQLAYDNNFTRANNDPEAYARAVKMGGGHDVQPGQTAYFVDPSERRRQIEAELDGDEKKPKGFA